MLTTATTSTMSDLYDLLAPYLAQSSTTAAPDCSPPPTTSYLTHLPTLSLSSLTTTEPAQLFHSASSHLRTLQNLSKRSHAAVISSSQHLSNLRDLLPSISTQTSTLQQELPALEAAATTFAEKYDRARSPSSSVLDRRKQAILLARSVDRVSDVLELPSLLSSTIASTSSQQQQGPSTSSQTASYASALDLHTHIQRLHTLHPSSALVASVSTQASREIDSLITILITSLQSSQLKLAAAIRTIGYLRRIAPDLAGTTSLPLPITQKGGLQLKQDKPADPDDSALGSLFLVCRLRLLHKTLSALDPLRDLADAEIALRLNSSRATAAL